MATRERFQKKISVFDSKERSISHGFLLYHLLPSKQLIKKKIITNKLISPDSGLHKNPAVSKKVTRSVTRNGIYMLRSGTQTNTDSHRGEQENTAYRVVRGLKSLC